MAFIWESNSWPLWHWTSLLLLRYTSFLYYNRFIIAVLLSILTAKLPPLLTWPSDLKSIKWMEKRKDLRKVPRMSIKFLYYNIRSLYYYIVRNYVLYYGLCFGTKGTISTKTENFFDEMGIYHKWFIYFTIKWLIVENIILDSRCHLSSYLLTVINISYIAVI